MLLVADHEAYAFLCLCPYAVSSPCRNGPGTMMYASGDVFEGLWKDDLKHGPGTYFYINRGKRFDGVWQEGACEFQAN